MFLGPPSSRRVLPLLPAGGCPLPRPSRRPLPGYTCQALDGLRAGRFPRAGHGVASPPHGRPWVSVRAPDAAHTCVPWHAEASSWRDVCASCQRLLPSTGLARRAGRGRPVGEGAAQLVPPTRRVPCLLATHPSLCAIPGPGTLIVTDCHQAPGAVLGMWPMGQPGEAPNSLGTERDDASTDVTWWQRQDRDQPAGCAARRWCQTRQGLLRAEWRSLGTGTGLRAF